jgi:hypothetical protein
VEKGIHKRSATKSEGLEEEESERSQQIQDSNSASYESDVDDVFNSDRDSEQSDEELGHAVAASSVPVPDDFLAMFDSDSAESDFDGF